MSKPLYSAWSENLTDHHINVWIAQHVFKRKPCAHWSPLPLGLAGFFMQKNCDCASNSCYPPDMVVDYLHNAEASNALLIKCVRDVYNDGAELRIAPVVVNDAITWSLYSESPHGHIYNIGLSLPTLSEAVVSFALTMYWEGDPGVLIAPEPLHHEPIIHPIEDHLFEMTDPWADVPPRTEEQLAELRAKSVEESKNEFDQEGIKVFTCDDCTLKAKCYFTFDWYNTNGDCIASK